MPLCNPRVKFLTYSGKKPVFGDKETISVNRKFASNNIRNNFKPVKSVQKKEVGTTREEEAQNKALEKERACKIQVKIVQIMKARKTIKYAELPMEVASQIYQFKAQPKDIKVQIEDLINKEYMKRSDNDRNMLEYLP